MAGEKIPGFRCAPDHRHALVAWVEQRDTRGPGWRHSQRRRDPATKQPGDQMWPGWLLQRPI